MAKKEERIAVLNTCRGAIYSVYGPIPGGAVGDVTPGEAEVFIDRGQIAQPPNNEPAPAPAE